MQHTPDYFIGMGLMCVCKLDLLTLLEAGDERVFRVQKLPKQKLSLYFI